MWEFTCAHTGWLKANGAEGEGEAPSDETHLAMIEAFKEREAKNV